MEQFHGLASVIVQVEFKAVGRSANLGVQILGALVLYMCSSFWLLGFESRDFSQAEKERTACKAEQIHKLTTIFTQNCHFVNLHSFASSSFFLSLRKIT